MQDNSNNNNDVFGTSGLSPRAQISEWVTVTGKDAKIGTSVKGKFLSWFFNPAKTAGYGDQIVLVLERESDKKVVAVPVKDKFFMDSKTGKQIHFIKDRVMQCVEGDMVGVRYDADKDSGPGKNPSKIVNIYNPSLEQRAKEGKVTLTQESAAPESVSSPSEADIEYENYGTGLQGANDSSVENKPEEVPF